LKVGSCTFNPFIKGSLLWNHACFQRRAAGAQVQRQKQNIFETVKEINNPYVVIILSKIIKGEITVFNWSLERFKGFLIGVCAIGLLLSIGTVYAEGKLTTIKIVQCGLKFFVDGKLIKPTDRDGKVVEPFIYDGTIYLPLRALSNALTNYEKKHTKISVTCSTEGVKSCTSLVYV
jgi:hypothetical protein